MLYLLRALCLDVSLPSLKPISMKYCFPIPVIVIFFLCLSLHASAQKNAVPQLPQVIPASPEASAIAKYINYPVNYSSGLPDISIPLFEVKAGGISFPVYLSYHASGLKVNELGGMVGIGWTLNAEPSISRKINGKEDEVGYLMNTNIRNVKNDPDHYFKISEGFAYSDEDPDDYYYRLPSKSGLFNFRKDCDTCTGYSIKTIPYQPVKITRLTSTSYTITDEQGVLVRYGRSLSNVDALEYTDDMITGMKATEIISASLKDTVFFDYQLPFNVTQSVNADVIYVEDPGSALNTEPAFTCAPFLGATPESNNTIESNNESIDVQKPLPLVKETIGQIFSKKYITNIVDADTWDFATVGCASTSANGKTGYSIGQKALKTIRFAEGKLEFLMTGSKFTGIKLYNTNNEVIKEITFHSHDVNTFPNSKLRLDSVCFKNNAGNTVETYSFGYHSVPMPSNLSKQMDHWGYYNGNMNPVSLLESAVPQQTVYAERKLVGSPYLTLEIPIGAAVKDPDLSSAQAGTLTSIRFPTGGETQFVYELNKYYEEGEVAPLRDAGGLRVKEILEYTSANNLAMRRIFKYGRDECGGGHIYHVPTLDDYYMTQNNLYVQPLLLIFNSVEGYKYARSTQNHYTRQQSFFSSSLTDLFFSAGPPVMYDEVAEYIVNDQDVNIGKTVYNFNVISRWERSPSRVPGTNITIKAKDGWRHGEMTGKRYYKNENGVFSLVKRNEYKYQQINVDPLEINAATFFNNNNIIVDRTGAVSELTWKNLVNIGRYNYRIALGYKCLQEENEYIYSSPSDSISTLKKYYYGNAKNIQPTRVETTDSKGRTKAAYTSYPQEYEYDNSFIGAMIDKNILSAPVEQVVWQESGGVKEILSASLNKYDLVNPSQLKSIDILRLQSPLNGTGFKLSNYATGIYPPSGVNTVLNPYTGYEAYAAFKYSNGNLVEAAKTGDVPVSYIWDYRELHPVAEVKNALNGTVAYTSFETGPATGNWTLQSNLRSVESITGGLSYNLSNGNITSPALNPALKYIVSFWSKSGSVTVPGTTESSVGAVRNGWTLHKKIVTGTTGITITGSGYIDELRLYPEKAEMSTYTYKALTGLTSKCDANNGIVYYEYDAFNRLKLIRDQDGKILKQYDYQYKAPITQ